MTGYINSTSSPLLKRSQLKSFVKDCSGLNCDKIVEILNSKLAAKEDHSVMVGICNFYVITHFEMREK